MQLLVKEKVCVYINIYTHIYPYNWVKGCLMQKFEHPRLLLQFPFWNGTQNVKCPQTRFYVFFASVLNSAAITVHQ